MHPLTDTLRRLGPEVSGAGPQDLARRRAALESDLETMVRGVLRTGTGSPGLLRWVRSAVPELGRTSPGAMNVERAAPVLARLLGRALVNQFRQAPAMARETIVVP